MKTHWTCPLCKFKETTSPHVKSLSHVHGKQAVDLTPFRKERRPTGEVTVKKLTKDLDEIFSEYIRRLYSDESGYCRCVTCGKIDYWKNMQAGHYISRAKKGTRYHEKNVHVQCPPCNGFGHGMLIEYKAFLLNMYGDNIINELEYQSKGSLNIFALQSLIKIYRDKLRSLP